MADNIKVLPSVDPSGVDVKTDDITGVHHPASKIEWGAAGVSNPVERDNPLPIIDPVAAAVIAGVSFFGGQIVRAVADAAEVDWLIVTGAADAWVGLEIKSVGTFEISMFEGTTTSADGTVQTNFNVKRSDTTTTINTLVYHAPTVTADGTELPGSLEQGGEKGKVIPTGADGKLLLKASTKYLLTFLNTSGAATDMQFSWSIVE